MSKNPREVIIIMRCKLDKDKHTAMDFDLKEGVQLISAAEYEPVYKWPCSRMYDKIEGKLDDITD